jgi:hypothetical protein
VLFLLLNLTNQPRNQIEIFVVCLREWRENVIYAESACRKRVRATSNLCTEHYFITILDLFRCLPLQLEVIEVGSMHGSDILYSNSLESN